MYTDTHSEVVSRPEIYSVRINLYGLIVDTRKNMVACYINEVARGVAVSIEIDCRPESCRHQSRNGHRRLARCLWDSACMSATATYNN